MAGLRGLSDAAVLDVAARDGRILITHDVNTMPRHYRDFLGTGRQSPGVFLLPQYVDIRIAIESLVLVWHSSDATEWRNRLVWIPI